MRGGGFRPNLFGGLFTALDRNKDSSVSGAEVTDTFAKWFSDWDSNHSGTLTEENIREGLNAVPPST